METGDRQTDRQTEVGSEYPLDGVVQLTEDGFRLANQWVLLTYETHLNKEVYKEWVNSKFKSYKIKAIYIAHEQASSETNYAHSHVYLDFGRAFQSTSCRIFDYHDIHPHIRKVVTKSKCGIYRYLMKEDKDLGHLKELIKREPIALKVWDCKTSLEVAMLAQKPSDVMGLLEIHRLQPLPLPKCCSWTLKPWQQELHDFLMTEPDDRSIYWLWERTGKVGKTIFCKYMMGNYPNKFIAFNNVGDMASTAENLKTAVQSGWRGHGVLFNLGRDFEEKSHLLKSLEMIKDGLSSSTKYHGGSLLMDSPHVVVMANWPPQTHDPETGKPLLSVDRWRIRELRFGEGELDSTGGQQENNINKAPAVPLKSPIPPTSDLSPRVDFSQYLEKLS